MLEFYSPLHQTVKVVCYLFQYSEAGVYGGVQGPGGKAGEGRRECRRGGQGIGGVEQALRNWVKAAAKGTPNGKGNRMVTPEERELSRLRAENARLKRELEIVKKAAAYFARDAL